MSCSLLCADPQPAQLLCRDNGNAAGSGFGAKPYENGAQLNASYGLDLDIVPGFFTWLSKAVVGNFGDGWKWNVPATQKFTEVIGLSVIMGGISLCAVLVIAVPSACWLRYQAVQPRGLCHHLCGAGRHFRCPPSSLPRCSSCSSRSSSAGSTCTASSDAITPSWIRWASSWTRPTIWSLPIVTLVIVSIGGYMRYTRTNMLEVLNADYIRTARAKANLSELFGHL